MDKWRNSTFKTHLRSFFKYFFISFTISSFTESLPLHHLCFTNYEGALLSKPPSQTKIINYIKSFKLLKAPRLDDIHPFFYQKYINSILSSITNLFNEIFTSGKFPTHLNKTLIALIPKTAIPESINQYRPISLCNNIYKKFTKILVNKLRPHINCIIDPLQRRFVLKHRASDNFIIVQETLNCFNSKTRNFMALEIDLEKAFDKIE